MEEMEGKIDQKEKVPQVLTIRDPLKHNKKSEFSHE